MVDFIGGIPNDEAGDTDSASVRAYMDCYCKNFTHLPMEFGCKLLCG